MYIADGHLCIVSLRMQTFCVFLVKHFVANAECDCVCNKSGKCKYIGTLVYFVSHEEIFSRTPIRLSECLCISNINNYTTVVIIKNNTQNIDKYWQVRLLTFVSLLQLSIFSLFLFRTSLWKFVGNAVTIFAIIFTVYDATCVITHAYFCLKSNAEYAQK